MGATCSAQKPKQIGEQFLQIMVHQWKEKEKKYTLFDYSASDSTQQTLNLESNVKICKAGENIIAIDVNQTAEEAQELFILKDHNVVPIAEMWSIVRASSVMGVSVPDKVKITEGQTIRLGRVKIVLQDACYTQAILTEESDREEDLKSQDEQQVRDAPYACRICMSKLGTLNNPLVNPCICSGSVKYTHIKCLSQWINSKIKTKELNNIILYYWTTMQCEICKENYKLDFQYQNRRYSLLDVPRPKEAYLVFSISHIDRNKEQGLYVINMHGRDSIKIGRVQENDIKLQDISVSRQHATIHMNKEEKSIYIEDHNSKFGTLIQSNGCTINKKTIFQVVNSLFVLEHTRKQKNHKTYELPQIYQLSQQKAIQQINQQQQVDVNEILVNDPNLQLENDNEHYLSGAV